MKPHFTWPCLLAALLLPPGGLAAQPSKTPPTETQPAATQPAETQPAAPTGPPVVTLIEAGAGPHHPLRFRPKVGVTQVIEMTVRPKTEQSLGGVAMPSQKIPAMQYAMEAVVKADDEAGDISYEFEYKSADVLDEPGVNPIVADMLRNAIKAISGLRGKGIMTDRGFNKLIKFDRTPDMDSRLLLQVGEMERSMEQLVSPFPSEPVGLGAVWQIDSTIQQQGMLIKQTAVARLVGVENDAIEVRMELTQTADPQELEVPGMPPMSLKSYTAQGTTTTTQRLGRLFPEASTTKMTTDTVAMINQPGMEQELKQHVELATETKTK